MSAERAAAEGDGAIRDAVDLILEQWRAERPEVDASPMAVIGRIGRANALLSRAVSPIFAGHDLAPGEFDILATLYRTGAPHRLTVGAIQAHSMVTSGAITHRLDGLARKGLVTRETSPESRRVVLVTLTDQGRDVILAALPEHAANEARLLDALSDADREQLADLLCRLLVSLGDLPPSR